MKRLPKNRRGMAVLITTLVLLGGLAPFVTGSHVNDLLTPWRRPTSSPTGVSLLDAAVGAAVTILDGVAEDERIKPLREEPQVPATFFHDIFDPADRIGGDGAWLPASLLPSEDPGWRLSPAAAGREVQVPWLMPVGGTQFLPPLSGDRTEIEQGYRFGGATGYSTPAGTQLISPIISLQSLPVDSPEQPNQFPNNAGSQDVDLTAQKGARFCCDANVDYADRIILYMDHRFNLASRDGNVDGASVNLFSVTNLQSQRLQPLRAINYDFQANAFSGPLTTFTEEAFDLSPWAGQDVRIFFQFTPNIVGNANQSRLDLFAGGCNPFCGWDISNVRIEGPAHLHNVRLNRMTYPSTPPADGAIATKPGSEPFGVSLLNRGQVTEDVETRMVVDGAECARVQVMGLRPGEVRVVEFLNASFPRDARVGCLDVAHGASYTVTFTAEILGEPGRTDLYDTDNTLQSSILGKGSSVRVAGRVAAEPALGRPNTNVTITLPLANDGIPDAIANVRLRIDRRDPRDADYEEFGIQWNKSLVTFEGDQSNHTDTTVTIPGNGGQIDQRWFLRMQAAGLYRVIISVTDANEMLLFPQISLTIGVLMAPEFAYDTKFDGSETDDGTILQGAWSVQSMLDLLPPCRKTPAGVCTGEYANVLELSPRRISTSDVQVAKTVLRGAFDVSGLQAAADQWGMSIAQLEIEFVHYAADIRCSTYAGRALSCDVPGIGAVNHPPNRLAVLLVEGTTEFSAGVPAVDSRLPPLSFPVQALGGSPYRNAYLTGQWLHEKHTVGVCSLTMPAQETNACNTAGGVQANRLAAFGLEFWLSPRPFTTDLNCVNIDNSQQDPSCPTWRVAEATVKAIPVGQPTSRIPLLRWSGIEGEPSQGTWTSFAQAPSTGARPTGRPPLMYPNCATTADNEQAINDNRGFCPIWRTRSVSTILPRTPESWSLQAGFWTNAEKEADDVYRYREPSGGTIDLLTSPVFKVPNAKAPEVSFGHRFQFHPYDEAARAGLGNDFAHWQHSPSYGDSGTVMVRFFDPGTGTQPLTPFLPLYLEANKARFMGHDCQWHYPTTHPDKGTNQCVAGLLARSSVPLRLNLAKLPILDYRDPSSSLLGPLDGRDPVTTGDAINDPQPAQGGAMLELDLRECADGLPTLPASGAPTANGPCAVQFAFRLEVLAEHGPLGSSIRREVPIAKEIARERLGLLSDSAEGWFIDSFAIAKDNLIDFDLELVNAQVFTDYNWATLGLGPGTEAKAMLTVKNNGFFPVTSANFHVTIQDALNSDAEHTWDYALKSNPNFELSQGQETTVNLTFPLPTDDGHYRIVFGADLLGDLIPGELAIPDKDSENNCRFLDVNGPTQATVEMDDCEVARAGSVPVSRNPLLGLELSVTPQAGRTGEAFAREINLRIINTGNGLVDGAVLNLVLQRASADAPPPQVSRWVVFKSPQPGYSASWTALDLRDPDNTDQPLQPLSRLLLNDDGIYFVTAFLEPSAADKLEGQDWQVMRQVRLDAFDTIYSNTFQPRGIDSDFPSMVTGEEVTASGPGWNLVRGQVPDRGSETKEALLWQFGDPDTGRYTSSLDESVYLPPIDLSAARRAILSISHNHALEAGYDGARVEASLDAGQTWLPLAPRNPSLPGGRGYPGNPLSADSALNTLHDPTVTTSAFTGDSISRNPLTNGWVIDEFDLAQLPGFTTPVVLERFSQDGYDQGQHLGTRPMQRNGAVTYHEEWGLPQKDCTGLLENCWSRENMNWASPAPLSPSAGYWWTNTTGNLQLDITMPPVESLAGRLVYTYWKDESGRLTVTRGSAPKAQTTDHDGATNGWALNQLDLANYLNDETFTVRFSFTAPAAPADNRANRGAAIDNARLEFYHIDSVGRVVIDAAYDLLRAGAIGEPDIDLVPLFTPPSSWPWVNAIPPTPEAWGIDQQLTRQGKPGLVWRYGTEFDLDRPGIFTYPANAQERLITPRIDLRGVAGTTASLTAWMKYDLMPGTARRVYVQVVEPTPDGGERLGPWIQLFSSLQDVSLPSGPDCNLAEAPPAWCPFSVSISGYIGQQVRFAFEVKTSRQTPVPPEAKLHGWTWLIDEVGVEAESLVGEPVRLRLRAASDRSISEGHWKVENVQLVGLLSQKNLGILPNKPLTAVTLDSNQTLDLAGRIRNLGQYPERNVFLNLTVEGPQGKGLPVIQFIRDADGAPFVNWTEGLTGSVGPIALGSAGATTTDGQPLDRIPFEIKVTMPSGVNTSNNALYRFSLQLQDENGKVVDDDNLGDHLRIFTVKIRDDKPTLGAAVSVYPPTLPELGQTAAITLQLSNGGPTLFSGTVNVNATQLYPYNSPTTVTIFTADLGDIPPTGSKNFSWEWTPAPNASDGMAFYRVTLDLVSASGHAKRTLHSHLLVGGRPLYYSEEFPTDPFSRTGSDTWSRSPAAQCPPATTFCWRTSNAFHKSGGQSLFLGNDFNAAGYGPTTAKAITPWIDLSFLAKQADDVAGGGEAAIANGNSPFKPLLSLQYQAMLAGTDAMQIWADDRPGGEGHRPLLSKDANSPRTGLTGLIGRDDVNLKFASFPLYDVWNSVLGRPGGTPANGDRLLDGANVSFMFFPKPWVGGNGNGFAVDRVTISSYDVTVAPPQHDVVLRLGSDKTYYFRIANNGAARDTYRIALDPVATADIFQSSYANVTVLTPTLTLDPGKSGLAAVRVQIPFQRVPDLFTGASVVLRVASSEDPNRVASGTVSIKEFIIDDLADLRTDLRRPRGETGPVIEGEQATFIVSVTNDGSRASRETDMVLFACPYAKEDPVDLASLLADCQNLGLGKGLGSVRLPRLLPAADVVEGRTDHVFTSTFSWVPPLGSRGRYAIVAIADPRQIVTQYDRAASIDSLDLEVAPIERPDLEVIGLSVSDAQGNAVTRAFAGDVLRIQGTIRNAGDAVAPNVKVRIINQFALRDERIGDLNPGGAQTFTAQWAAQPGNWVILLEATTSIVESRSDNNAERWSLAVRSGTLAAKWLPQVLHLKSGQSEQVVLQVENRRDQTADVLVNLTSPGIGVKGLPASLTLARGAVSHLPLVVTASPFAEVGHYPSEVKLAQRGGGTLLGSAFLDFYIDAYRELHARANPVHASPGSVRVPLVFTNAGSAPESFAASLQAPSAWSATVLQPSIRLEPGETQTVQAIVEIPAGTIPGTYLLTINAGVELRQDLPVEVVLAPAWRSTLQGMHNRTDRVELVVLVENIGNSPAAPPFFVGSGESLYSVEPAPSVHEPGETRGYRVLVRMASDPVVLQLPGQETPAPLDFPENVPPLDAIRFDVETLGDVSAGEVVALRLGVRGQGEQSEQQWPARLWVDGVLVDEQQLDLNADDVKDVVFRWRASDAGPRVVTASIGFGEETVARTMVVEVEPRPHNAGMAGSGLPTILAAAVAVLLGFNRRRFV